MKLSQLLLVLEERSVFFVCLIFVRNLYLKDKELALIHRDYARWNVFIVLFDVRLKALHHKSLPTQKWLDQMQGAAISRQAAWRKYDDRLPGQTEHRGGGRGLVPKQGDWPRPQPQGVAGGQPRAGEPRHSRGGSGAVRQWAGPGVRRVLRSKVWKCWLCQLSNKDINVLDWDQCVGTLPAPLTYWFS